MAEQQSNKLRNNFKDMAGMTFGRLTVVSLHPERTPNGSARWNCLCSCDTTVTVIVIGQDLRNQTTASCGCYRLEQMATATLSHGMSRSKEYKAWDAAKYRCFNQNSSQFARYGGRGITMSQEWRDSFEQFYKDLGPCPAGMTLDRIDNDGPYTGPCIKYPNGNCRWTDWATQRGNQRVLPRNYIRTLYVVHDGQTITLKQLSELTGIAYPTLRYRHSHGCQLLAPLDRTRRRT